LEIIEDAFSELIPSKSNNVSLVEELKYKVYTKYNDMSDAW